MGVGGLIALAAAGMPITQWKLGYGEFAVILILALAPLFPAALSIGLVLAFGAGCIFADYRSLGAICIVVAAVMLWKRTTSRSRGLKSWLPMTIVASVVVIALAVLLAFTQEQYAERRQQSNIGRYVGLMVAWRAISESPTSR